MRSGMRWVCAAAALGATGCTAGVGTQIAEPVRPSGVWEAGELAVLPVTAELGSEDAGPVVAEAVMEILARRLPSATLMPPRQARDRLGRAGAAAALGQLIRDYEAGGVADVARVDSVAAALGVQDFLQLRVGFAETEVLREELFSEDVSDEKRREVVLVARLWSAGMAGPAWEATARADSETGFLATELPEREEMLFRVVERLLARIPVLDPGPPDR